MKSWNKTGHDRHVLVRKIRILKIWPTLTRPWPFLGSNQKMINTIDFYVSNGPLSMCRSALMKHFDLVTLFDPTLTFNSIRPILICYLLHLLGSLSAKPELAAVISLFSTSDEAKSDDLDLWPDLDLTSNILKIFPKIAEKVLAESFRLTPCPPCYGHLFAS